jgi:hypothetical protein
MFNISRAKSGKLKSQKSSQSHGCTGRGGGCVSLLGKQRQSGNIRFTVGQYWLIIKITGTNYVNFVVNLVMYGKCVWRSEKFCRSGKFFGPVKWHTDRNFFGDGRGGEVAEINLFHKQFFRDWSGTIRKSRAITFRPPNFFLPVRPCFPL